MLSFLPAPLLGVIMGLLIIASTVWSAALILLFSPLKLVVMAIPALAPLLRQLMTFFQENWTANNARLYKLLPPLRWDVRGLGELRRDRWYFVVSNHQAWMDILASFHVLNRRIPPLKFFLKQELLYVPVVGLAVLALDYPFMKRHSAAQLARRPELRGQDLDTTRRACAKYSHYPVSVFNYLEGTRITPAKHAATRSRYRHLLPPKSAGAAFVLNALGNRMDCLLDLTVFYPQGAPSFWDFCCGRVRHIVIDIRLLPIPPHFCESSYESDPDFRHAFKDWIGKLWADKDNTLQRLHDETARHTRQQEER